MSCYRTLLGGILPAALFTVAFAQAATVYTATPANSTDTIIGKRQSNAPGADYYPDDSNDIVGLTGSSASQTRSVRNVVLGYTLPTLTAGETIDGATFNFNVVGVRNQPRLDVYLLDTANPDTTGTDFFFEGPDDTNSDVTYVGDYFNSSSSGSQVSLDEDVSLSLTGDPLTLLQGFYGGDHIPDQTEVFFRFNLDQEVPIRSPSYYRYNVNVDASASSLDITVIPEPSTLALAGLGLFGLIGFGRRRKR